jgi:hypothetical protein
MRKAFKDGLASVMFALFLTSCTAGINTPVSVKTEVAKPADAEVALPLVGIVSPAADGTYINQANRSAVVISGTCNQQGRDVSFSNAIVATVPCVEGLWSLTGDFSNVTDAPVLSLGVTLTNARGDRSEVTRTFIKDTTPPTIDIKLPVEGAEIALTDASTVVELAGSCSETHVQVSVKVDGAPAVGLSGGICDGTMWTATLSSDGLPLGAHTLIASISDAAGNNTVSSPVQVNRIDKVDVTLAPPPPVAATGLGWVQTSPHNQLTVNAIWTPSTSVPPPSQSLQFYVDNTCSSPSGPPIAVGATLSTYSFVAPAVGTYSYKIVATDSAQQSTLSGCSASMSIAVLPRSVLWIDASQRTIEGIGIDGTARRTVFQNPPVTTYGLKATATKLYWGAPEGIKRANLDGSGVEILVAAEANTRIVDLVLTSSGMLWLDRDGDKLKSATLDGASVTTLWTKDPASTAWVSGLAVNPDETKIYWTMRDDPVLLPSRHFPDSRIYRANLDATNIEVVRRGWVSSDAGSYFNAQWVMYPNQIEVNATHIIYTDGEDGSIKRVNVDTLAGVDSYQYPGANPSASDLTLFEGVLYAATGNTGLFKTCLTSPAFAARSCATAYSSSTYGFLNALSLVVTTTGYYFVETNSGAIKYTPLADLTSATTLVAGVSPTLDTTLSFRGIGYAPQAKYYFLGTSKGLYRVKTDGSELTYLSSTSGSFVMQIAVDESAHMLYFADNNLNAVKRINFDGSGLTTVFSVATSVWGLALDLVRGKIYFADRHATAAVGRANLDGSNIERLSLNTTTTDGNHASSPTAIVVDTVGEKIYVKGLATGAPVIRANLDGTGEEKLFSTNLPLSSSVAFDFTNAKAYYATLTDIHSINLDGTGDVVLGPSSSSPRFLILEP